MRLILFLFFLILPLCSQADTCVYEFDVNESQVNGTGFKFTEKVGVTGSFSKFSLNKTERKESIRSLLNNLVVSVDLLSLDSGAPVRDQNMRETLFSYIQGGPVAKVAVDSFDDSTINASLTLNEKTIPLTFAYAINEGVITAEGTFDALDLALDKGFNSLKQRCGSLHTGTDGKSVTWSTFDISVKATTKKICR